MEIQSLLDELDKNQTQMNDIQAALAEAQTIICQQQDELAGWRIRAAQSATDAEAFKMKNMFLTNGSKAETAELQSVMSACDQLEEEVKNLSAKLDESRRSQIRMQNENEYLKRQLQEASELGASDRISGLQQSVSHLQIDDTMNSVAVNVEREAMQLFMAQKEMEHQKTIEEYDEEIAQLKHQLEEWQLREEEWSQTERELIEQREMLVQEHQKQLNQLESLVETQRNISPPASESATSTTYVRDKDLEEQLRRSNQERNRWKQYACSLVRAFVENCEEFIQKTTYEEPEFVTAAERRWYDYSMYLLEVMLDTAPHRLAEMDLQLLKRSMSARRPTVTTARSASVVNPGPDILSLVQLRNDARSQKLTTSERVARIAVRPLFRYSTTERN
ncbi:unnamed protein product [Dicrocoelium dendriticum]|nr:unnamed protein product [Dicrocoelium dendriticum]